MKPSFALNLSHDGISLLHRTPAGWLQIGEAALDDPALGERLAWLRSTAVGLAPQGMTTKLIIPESQVLYTRIDAPGPDAASRRAQIAAALQGRTPYDVAELVFDWSGTGPSVQVAVVARETLEEAETFAVENRFAPLSFVAIPAQGHFAGEPFFGATAAARGILAEGDRVERDQDPIRIVGTAPLTAARPPQEIPVPQEEEEQPQPAPEELPEPEPEEITPPDPPPAMPQPTDPAPQDPPEELPQTQAADEVPGNAEPELSARDEPEALPDNGDIRPEAEATAPETDEAILFAPAAALPGAELAGLAEEPAVFVRADAITDPATAAFLDEPEEEETTGTAAPPAAETPDDETPADEAPFLEAMDEDEVEPVFFRQVPPAQPAVNAAPAAAHFPAETPTLERAIAQAAATSAAAVAAPRIAPPGRSPEPAEPLAEPRLAAVRAQPAQGGPGQAVTAPMLDIPPPRRNRAPTPPAPAPGQRPGAIRAKPGVLARLGGGAEEPLRPTQAAASLSPAGVEPVAAERPRARPRHLGLILTVILLLFLGAVALWSSLFLAEVAARLFGGDETEMAAVLPQDAADAEPEPEPGQLAQTDIPAIEDEAAADGETLDGEPLDQSPLAGAPDAPLEPATPFVEAAPAEEEPATDEAAADAQAVPETALAMAEAPQAMAPGGVDPLSSLRLVPGEPRPSASQGTSLPVIPGLASAPGIAAVAPTPGSTTGVSSAPTRVVPADPATELAVIPAAGDAPASLGFRRPAAKPAALVQAAAPAAVDLTGFAPADPAMRRPAPKQRPAAITQLAEKAAEATPADPAAALSASRAKSRPAKVAAVAEAAAKAAEAENPPVALAMMRPQPRPRNFSPAIEAAVAAAVTAPPAQQQTAAATVRTPAPVVRTPTRAIEPEEEDEPETASVAPSIPTRASVAKQATVADAINLRQVNLIGVYGTNSNRYALVRLSNGKMQRVRVGDTLDGGKVAAIGDKQLRYVKRGQNLTLALPKG